MLRESPTPSSVNRVPPIGMNLPNLLSLLRLALAPVIVLAVLRGNFPAALGLTLAAGITDAADGALARRFNWITRLGAYLDPIADKALLVGVYVALGVSNALPLWLVGMVFLRDILILLMASVGYLVYKVRDFPPSLWGKVSTILQVSAAVLVLTAKSFPQVALNGIVLAAIALTAVGTAWSGAHYIWIGVTRLRQLRRTSPRSSH